ncbi:MAG: carboxypeptidase-like regulatory domain-containing protein, partial [Holophagales bacterium]|nr:carboxypeptidase-like regulatory domain-containing protein [Holophagales bacterium]
MSSTRPRVFFATCIGLAVVHGILGPTGAGGSSPPLPEDAVPIYGRVLDPQGDPLPGAALALRPHPTEYERGLLRLSGRFRPEPIAETRSGADGWFQLVAPEIGFYRLTLEAEGFLPMLWGFDALPLLYPQGLNPIQLTAAATQTLRVLDAEGNPMPGVRLRLHESPGDDRASRSTADSRSPWRRGYSIANTDSRGRAELPIANPSHIRVEALDKEHGFLELCRREATEGPLALSPCAPDGERRARVETRRLQVIDAAGRPMPGVLVSLGTTPLSLSDADGRVEIPVDALTKPLLVHTEDGREDLVGAADDGLLRLRDGIRIEGRVVTA